MDIPDKYDRHWLNLWLILTVILACLLVGARLYLLHQKFTPAILPGFFLISLGSAFAVCVFGFFGARLLAFSTLAGILAGLGIMIGYYLRGGGWEDLAGPLAFLEFAFAGMAVGSILEFVRFITLGPRKKKQSR